MSSSTFRLLRLRFALSALTMGFMREQQLNIDMATDIIALPEAQECTPLMSMQALCIEPQSTVEITLLLMSGHN